MLANRPLELEIPLLLHAAGGVLFRLDPLGAACLAIISVVGLPVAIYGASYTAAYHGRHSLRVLGLMFNTFLLGMSLVPCAGNVLTFLLGWELMSVASYVLVMTESDEAETRHAGLWYIAMTHGGLLLLLPMFFLMAPAAGATTFADLRAGAASLPPSTRGIVFVLAGAAFGSKAGIVPLHVWLPRAHPAAPSHVSALMSGVMITLGLYGLLRVALDLMGGGPAWWGPLAASFIAIAVRPYTVAVGRANVALSALSLAAALWLCVEVLDGQPASAVPVPVTLWHVDAFSALLALAIALVTLLASALGPGLEVDEEFGPDRIRRFRIFLNGFALTMLAAVVTSNVGFMWVAIEATTITSAVLIPLHRTSASVEASWKYLLICSVGIALAFTGTVLAYFDFVSTAGRVPDALTWPVLRAAAPSLHPQLVQLAFVFILVGYGTKAGLAPMHTWLPDAHSEAPAPISAMMSGVLLAVAMYAVARWKAVVDAALASSFTSDLLVAAGLLSMIIGAGSLILQQRYKRMLAYSSVEHLGLVSVSFGLGPLGTFAAVLHLLNHAVAKSMTFLLAGRILRRYGTAEIAGVSGLPRAMPWTGSLFAVGVVALVGFPPFGLFVSEVLLVQPSPVAALIDRTVLAVVP